MKKTTSLLLSLTLLILISCGRGRIEKGNICLRLGDYSMAIEFFTEELQRNPGSYHARLGLGKAYIQKAVALSDDSLMWDRALTNLEAARTVQPTEHIEKLLADAWAQRARIHLDNTDTLAALTALTRSIEYDHTATEPINLAGIIYFHLGDIDKAQILFEKAVALDSLQAAGYFNLGMVHWHRKEYEAAHEKWLTALNYSPEDEDIIYWFAFAEKKLRERSGAAQ
jgi:tetratricopeptide (TPR) repeat protein